MKPFFVEQLKRFVPALITLAILAASIFTVSLVDEQEKKHALLVDFSFNSITTQSEQTKRTVQNLQHPVHAYALFTPGREDHALLGLLNRLSALSPKFSYTVTSLVENPLLVNTLSSSIKDEQVTADSLVLTCAATGRNRVLSIYDYLSQSFDQTQQAYVLDGISYEKSIVEALLYITLDTVPSIKILTGHGEIGETDTSYMESFLKSHHFEISRVNLLEQQELSPKNLLMILSPQKDLLDSELNILTDFIKKGGSVLITSDYNDPDSLPNFDALYRKMGFGRLPGIVVAEGADVNAYIDNPLFLTPYMGMTEPTAALIGAGQTRLRLPGARALTIAADTSTAKVDQLLISGIAYLKDVQSASESIAKEEGDQEGQFNLALLSDYPSLDGTRSRAMIIGNSAILLDSWLHQVTYGGQFLLHMVNHLSVNEPINLDIAPKQLVREQLQIPNPLLPNALIIALPLSVISLAILVLLRRRRR
ncbi:MAG: hypothetical protein GXZ04_03905 [Clostridiales bacterium]|nr:hypothetical protein [Clostridiales bacterium]